MTRSGRLSHRASRPETIRTRNERLVLDLLRDKGKLTRAELSDATSLTLPAIASITAGLVEEGLVREKKLTREGQGRGRPPVILEFIPDSSHVIGVRLGRVDTTIVLADALGREKARHTIPYFEDTAFEKVTPQLRDAIKDLLAANQTDKSTLVSIGIAIQGSIDPETNAIVKVPRMEWSNVPLAETITEAFDVPVHVIEAGRAGAVAEFVEGAARKHRNVIVIDIGAKVSAAIILNGRIVNGAHGLAGALGDCLVPSAPDAENFDPTGANDTSIADHVSTSALYDKFKEALPQFNRADASAWNLVEAAQLEDKEAARIIGQGGYYLSHSVAWLANLFDPDMIIMSGGMSVVPPEFQDIFINQVSQFMPEALRDRTTISFSQLGTEGWLRGAVLSALQGESTELEHLFDRASMM